MNTKNAGMKSIVPILRMFDVGKAKEFYIEFLGFQIEWEHRFEPTLPLYMEISSERCRIHLSEHHGDATPGSALRIEINDIETFHETLLEKKYPYAIPGLVETTWGTKEACITDPFGNRLVFYESLVRES